MTSGTRSLMKTDSENNRRKRGENMKVVRPTIRLTSKQNEWVQKQAQKQGVSFQKWIIHILEDMGMPKETAELSEGQISLFDPDGCDD